jgi:hypothetical protein
LDDRADLIDDYPGGIQGEGREAGHVEAFNILYFINITKIFIMGKNLVGEFGSGMPYTLQSTPPESGRA